MALARAGTCRRALAELMGKRPWLAGPAVTLADRHGALRRWWGAVDARPSVAAARFPAEEKSA